jgi:hypothetical protein
MAKKQTIATTRATMVAVVTLVFGGRQRASA